MDSLSDLEIQNIAIQENEETPQGSSPTPHPNACKARREIDGRVGLDTGIVFSVMREKMHAGRPRFEPRSPYVDYRRFLVDWMAETSEELKMNLATLHVAAAYLDRVLLEAHREGPTGWECSIPGHLWQLVAMVCLRIAGKFEENEEDVTGDSKGMLTLHGGERVLAVDAFTRRLGQVARAVTQAQVREWELFVLDRLEWKLSRVTAAHCLAYFEGSGVVFFDDAWAGRPPVEKLPRSVKRYDDFFLNLSLQDYHYAQFTPAHLAAAIVCASRSVLSLTPVWRPELEALTGYTEEHVAPVCTKIINSYTDQFPSHAHSRQRSLRSSPKGVGDLG